ncbi:Metallo-hydrolase/oxidoreductase [Daedaleopsis nitida]|nr:Metallo-hydrolase/oxidoreductase [Daedaleopsis nitida]
MSLPPPSENQAFWKVSALEGGHLDCPEAMFVDPATDNRLKVPSLCFLLRHSTRPDTFVFDLGIHKDWEALDPALAEKIKQMGSMTVPEDTEDALRKGGLAPPDITYVCISHIHLDHLGNPAAYTNATYLVGGGARALPDPSTGQTHAFTNKIFADLPRARVRFLDAAPWPALGPFPHALDLFGDGSLYVVDAPGHLPGHINVLARTSADGGWIYLAADSAHDWRIVRREVGIARKPMCMHADVEAAEVHIERIRLLAAANPRARVMLAHDIPWYEENKGGDAFWPGEIPSL